MTLNYDGNDLEQEFQYYASFVKENIKMADAFKAVAAGKAAIDGLKLLTQYVNDIKDVQKRGELMRIIGQLNLELAETQTRFAEQILEANTLKDKVRFLEKRIEDLENPAFKVTARDGTYYKETGDGPFCTTCYDTKKQLVRLTNFPQEMKELGKYQCPSCKAIFN